MQSYGEKLTSIPGRFLRWTLKAAAGYAVLAGVTGWALHRAAPQRTTAAWNAFWAKGQACDVPAAGAAVSKAKASGPAPAKASAKPEIVVYGRDTCGLTTRMRKSLADSGVPFRYAIIDEDAVLAEVSGRLAKIGHSGGFGLPVVAIGGDTAIRPSVDAVVRAWRGN